MESKGCGYIGLHIRTVTHACWTCEHWNGTAEPGAGIAHCTHPKCVPMRSNPNHGCSKWVRATGLDELDDETCDQLAQRYFTTGVSAS
ncbi:MULTISPECIES: hypothetical protein [Burkholderia]|uniref:hypothetical protein n=1 Tax=Burkholderia TaxID=32008 RepID=UPI0004F84F9A|nr:MULTISPECIES: hypothetical protein [Burkholderia]MCA8026461.1 hypothetical protein [Burkholderia cepacia]